MALVEIKEAADEYKRLAKALRFAKENYVLIGIPQKKTHREKEAVTNAELLFIHTKGSPINNIPARPVIEPAIADDKERLGSMLKKMMTLAMEGKYEEATQQLKRVGMRGQNISRAWFTNPKNNWPPNSSAVEKAKRKKGATEPKPLIDTGELRKSITYVLVSKGGRVE